MFGRSPPTASARCRKETSSRAKIRSASSATLRMAARSLAVEKGPKACGSRTTFVPAFLHRLQHRASSRVPRAPHWSP